MDPSGVAEIFSEAGGRFITPATELKQKLERIRAVVFDWDGVFNDGRKGDRAGSGFAEADSMGTNMLRYGLWRRQDALPVTAIISGENNESALSFARREHFDAAYTGIRDKALVIEHLCTAHEIAPDQIACVYDDINDLPMARACGARFRVRRCASPLFGAYTDERGLADYVSAADGGSYAVREIAELMLGLMACFADVVESRVACDDAYLEYFARRQATGTKCFTADGDEIVLCDLT